MIKIEIKITGIGTLPLNPERIQACASIKKRVPSITARVRERLMGIFPDLSMNKKDLRTSCKINPAIPEMIRILELSGNKRFHPDLWFFGA
ncbi:hypothetical protein KHM19_17310 [Leptospira borgpetersenii]|nr:hypothetical protein KHM09_16900 [Leptospira borgpetersenii]GIM22548.1 hypothetical protein KHM19_17310 [Leptospira borgpetersenii]GIM25868.1 hypothetical protein KHM25_17930 [Leptospira borgpetersenii]